MKALIFDIELKDPVLITALLGDANTETSLSYLPGTTLRGALISACGKQPEKSWLDGSIRFLNAYPLIYENKNKHRSYPIPLSWRIRKDDEIEIRDLAVEDLDETEREDTWVPPPGEYCYYSDADDDGARAYTKSPDRHIQIHTARNRKYGRALGNQANKLAQGDNPGAIFRYDALAAVQVFRAVILCEEDQQAEDLQRILEENHLFLGGARTAGYGTVSIGPIERQEGSDGQRFDEVRMAFGEVSPFSPSRSFILTFLSDAIIRDKNGQLTTDVEAIRSAIGVGIENAFIKPRLIGGYNRKWGLPLPQDWSVAKGSVLKVSNIREEAKLRHALIHGLGERRSEGFGRIAIDWQASESLHVKSSQHKEDTIVGDLDDRSRKFAQRIVERTVVRHWDRTIMAKSRKLASDFSNGPSKSQIGRARGVVQSAMQDKPDKGRQRIQRFVKEIHKRNATLHQWDGSQDILKNYSEKTDLQVKPKPLELSGIRYEPSEIDIYRANLRILDAALAIASKEKTQQESEES